MAFGQKLLTLIFSALLCLSLLAADSADQNNGISPPVVSPLTGITRGSLNPGKRGLVLPATAKVMLIPLDDNHSTATGMIDHWQAGFIERRLKRAQDEKFDLVVLQINTNGGRVDACERINEAIAKSSVPVIAFSTKAISGGAIVSLGCRMIVMSPGPSTQIGDSMAVSPLGDLPSDMRQKMDSKMRAMITTLCQANQFPCPIALGMVDRQIEVYELAVPLSIGSQTIRFVTGEELDDLERKLGSKPPTFKKWKSSNQILSLTASEAVDTGLAAGIALDEQELFTGLNIQPSSVESADITSGEKAARFVSHPIWRVLLVIIGLVALVLELKSPGHGVGYVTFAFCMGLFFWLQIFANTAGLGEIVLFGLGAVLLGLELFVLPGFGVAGFAGFVCIAVSVVLSFLPESASFSSIWRGTGGWQDRQVGEGILWAALTFLIVVAAAATALIKGTSLPGLSRMALRTEMPWSHTHQAAETLTAAQSAEAGAADPLVNQVGQAETDLRPAGKVRLNGVTYDAVTEGGYVEKESAVRVLSVQGKTLLVRST